MLVLGRVASLNVAERRIWIDDANIAQVFECPEIQLSDYWAVEKGFTTPQVKDSHEVLGLASPVQPTAAEGQSAKVLLNGVE